MLIGVAVAFLSAYALYLGAINVFLSTSLFEHFVDREPGAMFVTFRRAWSIWPGRVHAREVTVRGADSQVEWLLRVESCVFDVALTDLLTKRTFHLDRIRGSGVALRLRTRIGAPEATPEYVDALPPIPGFPRIPLARQEPPDLNERWDDRYYHLWSVELTDVIAEDVREVWVDTLCVEGGARVTGGFFLKPIRSVHVGPAHVDLREARVSASARAVAESLTGALDVRIATFDPRTVDFGELVHRISVSTELRGRVPELADLPRRMTGPLVLSGPVVVRRLALEIESGMVEKRTHVDAVAPGASVQLAGHRVAGDLVVVGDVPDGVGPAKVDLRLEARGMTARRAAPADAKPLIGAPALDLVAQATAVDLVDPIRTVDVELSMPDGQLMDRSLAGHLPRGTELDLARGHERFDARGKLTVREHEAAGSLDLHAPDLALVLQSVGVSGELRAHVGVHGWAMAKEAPMQGDASLELTKLAAHRTGATGPVLVVGRVGVKARSERFSLADPLARLDLDGAIEGGNLMDARVLDAFVSSGSDVTLDTARGEGHFDAALHMKIDGRVARGSASANTRGVGVRTAKLRVRGDVAASADVGSWSLDGGRMRGASGVARVEDLGVQFGGTSPGESAPGHAADLRSRSVELRASAAEVDLGKVSLADVDYRLVVVGAEIADVRKLGPLLGKGGPTELAIESGSARASADVTVSPSRKSASGGAKIALASAGVRFHQTHLRGAFDVDLRVAGLQPGSGHVVDISRSRVALRGVEAVGATATASTWSGELSVLHGALDVSDTPGLDAFVQLRADDANPILALILQNSLPGFLVDALQAPGLTGQARVVVEQDRAAVLDARLRGDNVVLVGDYATRPEHVRAAFTVAKGSASAGVKVDDEGTSVRFFGLESWRAEEKRSVLALFRTPTPAQAATATPTPTPTGATTGGELKAKAPAAKPR